MQYIYGLHAVDSLLRQNPRSVQKLSVQEGREDKRVRALISLARNQGVPVVRESRSALDAMVSARHQGVVAQAAELASDSGGAQPNLLREEELLQRVRDKDGPVVFRNNFLAIVVGILLIIAGVMVLPQGCRSRGQLAA